MDIEKVNLRHFLALPDIADTGRLSAAAERVHLSQSALTQALRKLEELAGVALFERAGFGVAETPAGSLLVARAKRAMTLMANAERELSAKHSARMQPPLHRHITASQLRALIATTESGGFSLAARRLGLSQPSVHRAAKELEAAVATPLFERAARGAAPTAAARVLARHAELVFGEVRQGLEEIGELQGRTNSRVAIGSLPLVRSEFLPSAVTKLLSVYPDARVSILDGPYVEQLHALRSGQIDWLIGALREPAPSNDVVQEALFTQPLAIVVRPGHPLLGKPQPTVDELSRLEWVAPRSLAPARAFFDELFERHSVPGPSRVIECSSLIATRGLLLQSDRAALLSPLQVREDVAAGELSVLIDEIPNSSRTIGIAMRTTWEPTKVQEAFTDIIRKLGSSSRAPDG